MRLILSRDGFSAISLLATTEPPDQSADRARAGRGACFAEGVELVGYTGSASCEAGELKRSQHRPCPRYDPELCVRRAATRRRPAAR